MKFTYTPEGAQPRSWDYNPLRLMSPEAEAIERHTGMTFAEWESKVTAGSMLAIHGLLFVMLKRTHPTLKWDEVQFCLDEVDFEPDEEEKATALAGLQKQLDEGGALSEGEAELYERLKADPSEAAPKD
jgi:hypothetical protein